MRDLYEALEVDRRATAEEIRAAFRRLAARHHPDRNPDDPEAQSRFQVINQAHQILGDPEQRRRYDRFGAAAFAPGGFNGSVDLSGLDNIFGEFLGALGLRGGRGSLRHKVSLSFSEAALGCKKEIAYTRTNHCSGCRGEGGAPGTSTASCAACQGRGRIRYQQSVIPIAVERPCSRCQGRGHIPAELCVQCQGRGLCVEQCTREVVFPPGVNAGFQHSIEGAGNRPSARESCGKLELVLEVESHEFFERDGDDVRCTVPITFAQAALGGEVLVPTIDGSIKLRVPEATQPGAVLRVRGKGVAHRYGVGRGDQLVQVSLEVPSRLGPRARLLIEELGRELGEDVQPQQKGFVDKLRALFG